MGKIIHFLPWQMSSGESLMRWAISIQQWERLRHVPIVWSMRCAIHPPKKRRCLLLRCDCGVPLLILEGLMVWSSTSSFCWTLSLSHVPRQSHVNLSSHLREAQALGVIMTYRRQPTGRGCAWETHTRAHTGSVLSTPLYSKLAEQSPHSSCS